MSGLVAIFLCLVIGSVLRLTGRLPEGSARALNAFVIWISLPALVLVQIPPLLDRPLPGPDLLVPVSMPWIQFALAFILFYGLGKFLRWTPAATGALALTAGFGNTSFVGLPILELLFGAEGVRIGILIDQPGSFLALATVGVLAASFFAPAGRQRVTAGAVARHVATFPPFVALFAAVLWHASGTPGPGPLVAALERLASTLLPLALVAVGLQLDPRPAILRRRWRQVALGLGFKLFLAPLFFVLLYGLFAARDLVTRVTILEAAMAPMITAGIVAEDFGLDAELIHLMVGLGIPLSLGTVFLWNYILL